MDYMGNTFRKINKMVEYFTALYWGQEDIPYVIQGRPSEIDHTNMTIISGKHSYYMGASRYKVYIYELGEKAFPDQLVDTNYLENLEYDNTFIKMEYNGKTLYLELYDGDNSYLK